jgi:hypothetical protein
MDNQLVNDYDIKDNSITSMANSEALFNACLSKKPQLTKQQFRQNLDTAQRIILEYQKKQILEPETVITSDLPPCPDCGGTFFLRTGTCHACQTCGASQGCS